MLRANLDNPDQPITVTANVPTELAFEASPGAEIPMFIEAEDIDKRTTSCPNQPPVVEQFAISVPHYFRFICLNGGLFTDPMDNDKKTVIYVPGTIDNLNQARFFTNVIFTINSDWDGSPIRVIVQIQEPRLNVLPDPSPPDEGSFRDKGVKLEWSITKRTKPCPLSLNQLSNIPAQNDWHIVPPLNPLIFTYQAMPELTSPRPNYTGASFVESLEPATPLGFTMDDLTQDFKDNNPDLNTVEKVAASEFPDGNLGTFVFFSITVSGTTFHDIVQDQHSGFADVLDIFVPDAFRDADGVGYINKQIYSCDNNQFDEAFIHKRLKNIAPPGGDDFQLEIKKIGP